MPRETVLPVFWSLRLHRQWQRAGRFAVQPNKSAHRGACLMRYAYASIAKSLGIRDALFTADQLIRHGCHGPALRVIGSLVAANRRNEAFSYDWKGSPQRQGNCAESRSSKARFPIRS